MDKKTVGRLGEDAAARYLRRAGWEIVDRNVRFGRGEVDLIVRRGSVIAFVEVKCRRDARHGHPMEAIDRAKRREIARVARAWIRAGNLPKGVLTRFDAVAVFYGERGGNRVEHVPDAWRLE
jgi:putative endonuclease